MTHAILRQQVGAGCAQSRDLVLAVTMPGKGRAWERSSINGEVHFTPGEGPSRQVGFSPGPPQRLRDIS